ncbi:ABC transporter substrate-binding protein [Acrocarpospora catenulata]|uniref:ABC transporter substrate-binding protein n=1 Tax=Acrocarpospora catenulata TaxID=2836182 RepID=UPI001BDB5A94|nr:ABC transporter substrate-binding protein [Acrocarpospora catenulata]
MRKLCVFAVASVGVLVLAGCGSTGGSDTGGDATGPIELFQLTEVQSATTSLPMTETSAKAAVAQINAAGGINGRKLVLTTCNEAGDPNTAIKCAQQAVQDQKFVAMVGGFSLFGPQVNPITEAGKIANIGLDAVTPNDGQSMANFVFDLGVPGYSAMPAVARKYLNATKAASFLLDSAAAASIDSYFKSGAERAGVQIVKTVNVPVDAVDYTQFVAQAEDAGAEVILSGMSVNNNLALWKALESSGSKLKTVMSDGGVSQSLIDQAGKNATEGNYTVNGIPSTEASNPTGKAYREAMAAYAPDEKVIAGVGMRAWLSVHLFAEVAKKIDGPVTRESVLRAMSAVSDMKFYWIDALSFDKPGPLAEYPRIASTLCFPSKITDGKYQPLDAFDPFARQ